MCEKQNKEGTVKHYDQHQGGFSFCSIVTNETHFHHVKWAKEDKVFGGHISAGNVTVEIERYMG